MASCLADYEQGIERMLDRAERDLGYDKVRMRRLRFLASGGRIFSMLAFADWAFARAAWNSDVSSVPLDACRGKGGLPPDVRRGTWPRKIRTGHEQPSAPPRRAHGRAEGKATRVVPRRRGDEGLGRRNRLQARLRDARTSGPPPLRALAQPNCECMYTQLSAHFKYRAWAGCALGCATRRR